MTAAEQLLSIAEQLDARLRAADPLSAAEQGDLERAIRSLASHMAMMERAFPARRVTLGDENVIPLPRRAPRIVPITNQPPPEAAA